MVFGGDAVALPEDLAACANGGQVVLSEAAWSAVQEQLPGACQVILSSCFLKSSISKGSGTAGLSLLPASYKVTSPCPVCEPHV